LPEGLRDVLQPELPRAESQQSLMDVLLRNRRWVGAGAGLLVMVGSGGYWWHANKSSPNSVSNLPTISPSPTPIVSNSPITKKANAQPSASPTPIPPKPFQSPSPIASNTPVTGTIKVQSPDSPASNPPTTSPSPSPIASNPVTTGTIKVQTPDSPASNPPTTSPLPSPIASNLPVTGTAKVQSPASPASNPPITSPLPSPIASNSLPNENIGPQPYISPSISPSSPLSPVAPLASVADTVIKYGFEENEGWWLTGGAGIDSNKGFASSGKNNGYVRNTSDWNAINNWITVKPNTTCFVSADVRKSTTLSNGYISVRPVGEDGNAGSVLNEIKLVGDSDQNSYKKYSFEFQSGNNSSLLFYVGLWGNGKDSWIQVDDITVACPLPLSKQVSSPSSNPQ
jgi:hypothetical protein